MSLLSDSNTVALFFTYGVSLKEWDQLGYLAREIQLYKSLARRGINTSFITYGDASDLEYQEQLAPIKIEPFYANLRPARTRAGRYLQSLSLPRIMKKPLQTCAIYKTNQMWGSWAATKAARIYHKPLLLRCGYEQNLLAARQGRSSLYRMIIKMVSRKAYRAADRIHLACDEDSRFVQNIFAVPAEKIVVRMNFVDPNLFTPKPGIKEKNSILYVGRLAAEKNLFMLLDAVKDSEYSLTLVGAGEDELALKKYAGENNIRVDFTGSVPNDKLPGLLNSHAVFILCSRYEGNPKALLEAMACGAAVIGSDVTGINSVISHNVTGWLSEPNAKALRAGIDHLMESQSLRENLGLNARKYIMGEASLESYADAEAKIYTELIKSNQGKKHLC